jgi:glyoxylase-like metal-dependent hydrolase (beta-lactamase superfamily II)
VLYDETRECIIIDPGCYDGEEENKLLDFILSNNLQVKKLVNTHCHIDHVLGNAFVKHTYKVSLIIHPKEEQQLRAVKAYAPNYGFAKFQETMADEFMHDGDNISFGHQQLKVLFVPGHSPGHVALYSEKAKVVIGGDVLFENSIGRTDLPGGDYDTLIQSIHTKLFTLPDDVTVYCGHGTETSVGFEKRTNPFCSITS